MRLLGDFFVIVASLSKPTVAITSAASKWASGFIPRSVSSASAYVTTSKLEGQANLRVKSLQAVEKPGVSRERWPKLLMRR